MYEASALRGILRLGHALTLSLAVSWAQAQAPLAVAATTGDLKSLAELVGAGRVRAAALVPPGIDAEQYQPRPQDLALVRSAKVVLRVGADYDLWLDRLLAQSGNAALERGGAGYVDCSYGIALLDVRGMQVGPSGGHAHGSGNPHYWLDPANARLMSEAIVDALARNDPAGRSAYEAALRQFLARLAEKTEQWQRALAPARGQALIAYHNNWAYFARRFRLEFAGTIEPRPGVPPSAAHLAALLSLGREQRVRVIVRQPHESPKDAEFLAERLGARVTVLAGSVGALPEAADYFSLFDADVAALAAALRR